MRIQRIGKIAVIAATAVAAVFAGQSGIASDGGGGDVWVNGQDSSTLHVVRGQGSESKITDPMMTVVRMAGDTLETILNVHAHEFDKAKNREANRAKLAEERASNSPRPQRCFVR